MLKKLWMVEGEYDKERRSFFFKAVVMAKTESEAEALAHVTLTEDGCTDVEVKKISRCRGAVYPLQQRRLWWRASTF